MMNLLYVGTSSICVELAGTNPYYAENSYRVILNGEEAYAGDTNVFSLYGLIPGTEYQMTVEAGEKSETIAFKTASERCALSVRDFGATGDGETDDTDAIQRAIAFLPEGGRLVVPEGTYRIRPLALKSHMTMELTAGATLLGSPVKEEYPVLPGTVSDLNGGEDVPFGVFEGIERDMYQGLLTAQYAEDITIIGPGKVDGNAQNSVFWKTFRQDPVSRPRLLFVNRCKNVTLHGVSVCNSASWQLHPFFSEKLKFYNVTVTAPKVSPNTDALDPESCDDVEIIGCKFSVGDDCIAIKSGKIDMAKKYHTPASRHTIRNCLMENGHGAITLGSEISGGLKELSVSQCLFRETDRGLRIKSRRGRGRDCDIDGVSFSNIKMEGVLTPIVINAWYNAGDPDGNSEYSQTRQAQVVDERTPHLGVFSFSDMVCEDVEVAACYIDGLPEAPVDSVTLKNVKFSYKADARPGVPAMMRDEKHCCRMGLYFDNVGKVELCGVSLVGQDGEKLIAGNTGEITGQAD